MLNHWQPALPWYFSNKDKIRSISVRLLPETMECHSSPVTKEDGYIGNIWTLITLKPKMCCKNLSIVARRRRG